MTRSTAQTSPAADETSDVDADAAASAGDVVQTPAGPPPVGALVRSDVDGRYGIVVDPGRTPGTVFDPDRNRELAESHEPIVLWFAAADPSPYGLPLTTVLPPG